jgi:hypothetical protein
MLGSAMPMDQSLLALRQFCGPDLTATLARIESSIQGVSVEQLHDSLLSYGSMEETLAGAGRLKQLVGQLNVVIHALGILLCLPKILETGERIESVSLGAGNTGRPFDLETDRRVAEFKFIRWQGGAETIRQNGLFKDFYLLAEHDTPKKKCLYVLETRHPLKFLNGGRALDSVLSKNVMLHRQFHAKYADKYRTVRDYYQSRESLVLIEDVSPWLSGLLVADEETEATL